MSTMRTIISTIRTINVGLGLSTNTIWSIVRHDFKPVFAVSQQNLVNLKNFQTF